MNAFVFPGQGCQKIGMGKDLYDKFTISREFFSKANASLGWDITDVMFNGTENELMETKNTQPAIFVYEVALAKSQDSILPDIVAGHSLGEFAALVISGVLDFEEALRIVYYRAIYGQEACEKTPTAMAAVIGLSDEYVDKRIKEIWDETGEPIYFANFNGPGQVVISGSKEGIKIACKAFKNEGAKKAVRLAIGGSFHTPFMAEAQQELKEIILKANFRNASIPVVQCVDAKIHTDASEIRRNLINHITSPVQWTSMVNRIVENGVSHVYEVGTDDTLQKIVKRMAPSLNVDSILNIDQYKGVIHNYSIIN